MVDHADCIHDAVGDASRKVSSIMPSPPDAPPDRQAVPEATTRDGADERQQRQYRLRHRVGLFDTVLWIMVHSVTLVLAAVYLAQAKERQGSMIRMYVDAANAAVPPS